MEQLSGESSHPFLIGPSASRKLDLALVLVDIWASSFSVASLPHQLLMERLSSDVKSKPQVIK